MSTEAFLATGTISSSVAFIVAQATELATGDQTIQAIERLGLPVVLIFASGWCIYKSGKWVGQRLFGEETGIVTNFFNGHTKHVERLDNTLDQVCLTMQQVGAHLSNHDDKLDKIEARSERIETLVKYRPCVIEPIRELRHEPIKESKAT